MTLMTSRNALFLEKFPARNHNFPTHMKSDRALQPCRV